jgi:hypothetical protein
VIAFAAGGFTFPKRRRRYLLSMAVLLGAPVGILFDVLVEHEGPDCSVFSMPINLSLAIGLGIFFHFIFRKIRPEPIVLGAQPCAGCGYDALEVSGRGKHLLPVRQFFAFRHSATKSDIAGTMDYSHSPGRPAGFCVQDRRFAAWQFGVAPNHRAAPVR